MSRINSAPVYPDAPMTPTRIDICMSIRAPHDHATTVRADDVIAPLGAMGQTGDMFPGVLPTKGRLLVATPPLEDPHFDRTVVFMLEHHDDGAIGVVINRPSIESLDEPLDRWIDLQSAPSSVFSGGPVEENALIALAETKVLLDERRRAPVADHRHHRLGRPVRRPGPRGRRGRRACACSAATPDGDPGSWRARSRPDAWLVLDSEPGDVFSDDPDELWRTVLRRQPGRLAWLADAPDDLSSN